MKGKTYEELYGIEHATRLKALRVKSSSERIITDETKHKMRLSALNKMANGYLMPSRKNVKDSAETKNKKSLAHIGKIKGPMSDETKRKISETKRNNSIKRK